MSFWGDFHFIRPAWLLLAPLAVWIWWRVRKSQDPLRAWFVPAQSDTHRYPVGARMVVTRTDDGGNSFTLLDQGLPQRDWRL